MSWVCVCVCAALNPKGHFKWDYAVTKCHINITRTEKLIGKCQCVLKKKNKKKESERRQQATEWTKWTKWMVTKPEIHTRNTHQKKCPKNVKERTSESKCIFGKLKESLKKVLEEELLQYVEDGISRSFG